MPKSPDFDQIASRIFSDHGQASIAKALRDMWNARGEADMAVLESHSAGSHPPDTDTFVTTSGVATANELYRRALKSLDR